MKEQLDPMVTGRQIVPRTMLNRMEHPDDALLDRGEFALLQVLGAFLTLPDDQKRDAVEITVEIREIELPRPEGS